MIDVPLPVRNNATALGAARWLADLPGLVAALERAWSLAVGRIYPDATEAFVAEAVLDDGTAAVLKLHIPRDGGHAAREIAVLGLAGGAGCVRLLRHDAERGALLLERLGRSLFQLALPLRRRQEILCDLAARVWRAAPGCGLPTGADLGKRLVRELPARWERLDRPCSERAIEYALACAARRIAAHDDERAVLVHGDVHQWNALEARDGFRLVDPDGWLVEREYDLGVLMREDSAELLAGGAGERCRWLAARTGLDASAIWDWGVVERVANGLDLTQIDLQPIGREMLAVADRVATEEVFA